MLLLFLLQAEHAVFGCGGQDDPFGSLPARGGPAARCVTSLTRCPSMRAAPRLRLKRRHELKRGKEAFSHV